MLFRSVRASVSGEAEILDWLQNLQPVDYISKKPQALVLRLDNGAYVAGVRVEEAAFISINAAQAAASIAISEFGPGIRIEEAWARGEALLPSALQTLRQFSKTGGDVPLSFFPCP